MNGTIQKTVALLLSLAKLHNFCINADNGNSDTYTASDEWLNELNGAVPLVATTQDLQSRHDEVMPKQLLHGRHHFDDIGGIVGGHNRQRRWSSNLFVNLPGNGRYSICSDVYGLFK